jgi:hypothetical protein
MAGAYRNDPGSLVGGDAEERSLQWKSAAGAQGGGTHSPELFGRWLVLFDESCREMLPPELAEAMHCRATQIFDSLKAGLFFRPAEARFSDDIEAHLGVAPAPRFEEMRALRLRPRRVWTRTAKKRRGR